MNKVLGILLIVIALFLLVFPMLKSNYEYNKEYSSYWHLAEKSSTITAKSEYVDKFVNALEHSGLQGQYDALVFQTQDNSFDKNFEALKTLQARLKEIKGMNVNSFEYQTAIQQITAQEQGEAENMLNVISGCWTKVHYPYLWNLFGFLYLIWWVLIIAVGWGICARD
jgi:hypothetical protein